MWNGQIGLRKETIPVIQLASVQILLTKPTFSARGWFLLDMTFIHTVNKHSLRKQMRVLIRFFFSLLGQLQLTL